MLINHRYFGINHFPLQVGSTEIFDISGSAEMKKGEMKIKLKELMDKYNPTIGELSSMEIKNEMETGRRFWLNKQEFEENYDADIIGVERHKAISKFLAEMESFYRKYDDFYYNDETKSKPIIFPQGEITYSEIYDQAKYWFMKSIDFPLSKYDLGKLYESG